MRLIENKSFKWMVIWIAFVATAPTIAFSQYAGHGYMIPYKSDTLLYMTDYLPKGVRCGFFGSDSTKWDLNGVKAPYIRKSVIVPIAPSNNDFHGASGTISISGTAKEYIRTGTDSVLSFGLDGIELFGDGHFYQAHYAVPKVYRPLDTDTMLKSSFRTNKLIYPVPLLNLPASLRRQLPYTPDSIRVITTIEESNECFKDIRLDLNLERNSTLLVHKLIVLNTILETRKSTLDWQNVTRFVKFPTLFRSDTIRKSSFYSMTTKDHIATIFYKSAYVPDRIIYRAPVTFKDLTVVQDFNPGLFFFPNPYTVGTLRCELNIAAPGLYTLRIVNLLGSEIKRSNYYLESNKSIDLDLSFLTKGTYFMVLEQDKNHVISTKRLLVIRS